jgi:hypothetical protein
MPPPGFKTLGVNANDLQRLEQIKQSENLSSNAEALRMLMRDWEINRRPKIQKAVPAPGFSNGAVIQPGYTSSEIYETPYGDIEVLFQEMVTR